MPLESTILTLAGIAFGVLICWILTSESNDD